MLRVGADEETLITSVLNVSSLSFSVASIAVVISFFLKNYLITFLSQKEQIQEGLLGV